MAIDKILSASLGSGVGGKIGQVLTTEITAYVQLRRGTTLIGNSTAGGSRIISIASDQIASVNDVANVNFNYIDSPSTNSEVTYNIYGCAEGGSNFLLNRSINDSDGNTVTRGTSVITVMEVLA